MEQNILVINPGSTSTKIALFDHMGNEIFIESISHSVEELSKFTSLIEQAPFRKKLVLDALEKHQINTATIQAVVGRGGILKPLNAGTYQINDKMIEDLQNAVIKHASNLGGMIAKEIADKLGIISYIADPVSVDEFSEVARISGLKGIIRKSLLHTLNIRASAFRFCREEKKDFTKINLIVAHLGGGISIAPIQMGKIIDVNNANDGGPFSPERTGSLPNKALIQLCFSGKYTEKEVYSLITKQGGLTSYLGTNDLREVLKMMEMKNKFAKLIFDAMSYQIAKEIGAMATVLKGKVEAIILTGGIAHSNTLVNQITKRISWIATVKNYPGEKEMIALAYAVIRVINQEEKVKVYS